MSLINKWTQPQPPREVKGKLSSQDPQDQVLSTEDIYLLLRDRGRNKRQIQGIEDEGEGEGKGGRGICL